MKQNERKIDPTEAQGERLTSRSRRGLVGRHWWAQRWSRVIGEAGLPDRLHRGRTLARAGSVFNLRIDCGEAFGEVKQARSELHAARVRMAPIDPESWPAIIDLLCERSHYIASLLAGILPAEVEDEFKARGLLLFPDGWETLEGYCSCEDPADPCAHLAAVYYLAAERIDKDPFLLLRFRGSERDDLLRSCREWRGRKLREQSVSASQTLEEGGAVAGAADAPLTDSVSGERDESAEETERPSRSSWTDFWGDPERLRSDPGTEPPSNGVIEELGWPPGVESKTVSATALEEAYDLVAEFAAELSSLKDSE